jgi:hypothetical protein
MTLEERIKGQFGEMLATIINLSQQVEDLRLERDHLSRRVDALSDELLRQTAKECPECGAAE